MGLQRVPETRSKGHGNDGLNTQSVSSLNMMSGCKDLPQKIGLHSLVHLP
jgi:hypothetical protein